MPIFNKDGTPYKLQGVNPLMQEQDHWNESEKVEVHDVIAAEEVVMKDPTRVIPDHIPEDTPVAAVIGVGIVTDTTIIYCLPMVMKVVEDPVYGDKKMMPDYGDKFTFEGIMTDYNGVAASFFGRLPPDKTPLPGSILYVWKERQWWKVSETFPQDGGVQINCVVSDRHPSFNVQS